MVLTVPVSTASSERDLNNLKIIENYLRNMLSQEKRLVFTICLLKSR